MNNPISSNFQDNSFMLASTKVESIQEKAIKGKDISSSINGCDDDVIWHIFFYLSSLELIRVGSCSKRMKKIADNPRLWRNQCEKRDSAINNLNFDWKALYKEEQCPYFLKSEIEALEGKIHCVIIGKGVSTNLNVEFPYHKNTTCLDVKKAICFHQRLKRAEIKKVKLYVATLETKDSDNFYKLNPLRFKPLYEVEGKESEEKFASWALIFNN